MAEVRFNVHAYISKNVWMKLIKEALDLTYLDMTPAEDMTDANIKSILLDHPKSLKKLRNFIVRGRHRGGDIALTEASIDNLASRCSSIRCCGFECQREVLPPEQATLDTSRIGRENLGAI